MHYVPSSMWKKERQRKRVHSQASEHRIHTRRFAADVLRIGGAPLIEDVDRQTQPLTELDKQTGKRPSTGSLLTRALEHIEQQLSVEEWDEEEPFHPPPLPKYPPPDSRRPSQLLPDMQGSLLQSSSSSDSSSLMRRKASKKRRGTFEMLRNLGRVSKGSRRYRKTPHNILEDKSAQESLFAFRLPWPFGIELDDRRKSEKKPVYFTLDEGLFCS